MSTNKEKLGRLGEQLVVNLLGATANEDWYDQNGDATLNGETIETKTQSRHVHGYFSINTAHKNQLRKCAEVDRLIFVEYDNTSIIKVFECPKSARNNYIEYTTKDGRRMRGWYISEMTLLTAVKNPELAAEMRSLSQSSFIKR